MTYRPIVPVLVVIVLCAAGCEAGATLPVLLQECVMTCMCTSLLCCDVVTPIVVRFMSTYAVQDQVTARAVPWQTHQTVHRCCAAGTQSLIELGELPVATSMECESDSQLQAVRCGRSVGLA